MVVSQLCFKSLQWCFQLDLSRWFTASLMNWMKQYHFSFQASFPSISATDSTRVFHRSQTVRRDNNCRTDRSVSLVDRSTSVHSTSFVILPSSEGRADCSMSLVITWSLQNDEDLAAGKLPCRTRFNSSRNRNANGTNRRAVHQLKWRHSEVYIDDISDVELLFHRLVHSSMDLSFANSIFVKRWRNLVTWFKGYTLMGEFLDDKTFFSYWSMTCESIEKNRNSNFLAKARRWWTT